MQVLTITVHCAMSTRLFPIAFDLLATAFVTGPCDPSSLLQGICGFHIETRIVSHWGALETRLVRVIVVVVMRIGGSGIVIGDFGLEVLRTRRCGGHGGRKESWEAVRGPSNKANA